MRKRFTFAALIVLLVVMIPSRAVQAHAYLLSSDPSAGQVLKSFPGSIRLEFSEEVESQSAQVRLFDEAGGLISSGQASLQPDGMTLLVSFPSQPDGLYTLAWQVVSLDDGHLTSGTVAFSVGLNAARASLLPPLGAPDPASLPPALPDAALRWLGYLGLSLAVGSAVFGWVIWRPALRAVEPGFEMAAVWDERLARLLRRVVLVGCGLMLASLVGVRFSQVVQSAGGIFSADLPQTAAREFGGAGSLVLWARAALLLVLAALAIGLPLRARASSSPARLLLIPALGLALGYSFSGHNAALGQPGAVVVDFIHLLGMSAWLGGLMPLAFVLAWSGGADSSPQGARLAAHTARRFSALALGCVAAIALSGLASAYWQVRTPAALLETRYGQVLLVKSALFGALILLGALNRQRIMPALPAFFARRRLGQSVRAEYGIGALLLLAVGALMTLAPAYPALLAGYRQGIQQSWQDGGVSMVFRAAPARVGDNEFGVDVRDTRPGMSSAAASVTLVLRPTVGEADSYQLQPQPAGPPSADGVQRFTARGSYLTDMVPYLAEVTLNRPGFAPVRHVFEVDLPQQAARLGERINPVPNSYESIDRGHVLYLQHCQRCHGTYGMGDGPLAASLTPPPGELPASLIPGIHTDDQLYRWITQGYPNSAMPAYTGTLNDQQVWDIVNYLRSFAQ